MICLDTCGTAGDGVCQDGGWKAFGSMCEFGTDCSDCGSRLPLDPPPSPPALPPGAIGGGWGGVNQCSCSEDAVQAAEGAVQTKQEAVQAQQDAVQAQQDAVQAKQEAVQAKQEVMQAKQEAIQAKQDAEQAKQAAATLMEEYERRKLSAAALESASSGLSLGQTIGVAVGCSLAVVLLVALGVFVVLKRGRRKGPSATNEAASGVQLKGRTEDISEPSDLVAVVASRR